MPGSMTLLCPSDRTGGLAKTPSSEVIDHRGEWNWGLRSQPGRARRYPLIKVQNYCNMLIIWYLYEINGISFML